MAKDDPTFGRFQSPLHRGNHFNDEIGASDEVPNIDFSPLFIGEITSTSLLIRLLGEEPRFQSPLHRGNHFNKTLTDFKSMTWVDFSPLFIGEITSTKGPLQTDKGASRFQSPLHRGNHFNDRKLLRIQQFLRISVPSSSGKSLQPVHCIERSSPWPDFSPLFIGEITSTKCTMCGKSYKGTFQSPLHRGNHFNASYGWVRQNMD